MTAGNRADLLTLDVESLIVLSNTGLVKRAQKEVGSGLVPTLREDADGTLHASFKDGANTRLPPGVALRATTCTCGAAVCRHRVAAVLAYHRLHGAASMASAAGAAGGSGGVGSGVASGAAGGRAGGAAAIAPWNPGELSDEDLDRAAPAGRALAERAIRGSCIARVVPGVRPVVELPTSTVQFLVPRNLAFAKCDCSKAGGCEHVVLAVWAFRAKPEGGVVELGAPPSNRSAETHLDATEAALLAIAACGMADTRIAHDLREARAAAEHAKLVWIADALRDLELQKEAYDRQSALFRASTCAALVAELGARVRASRSPRDVPARWILGADEERETRLDQIRLTGLGARLEADGARRIAWLYFAERDTKSVLVLRKEWTFAEGDTPKNGAELGAMFASSRLSVAALAKGEVVARGAARHANGEIDLSLARGMKSTMLLSSASWGDLPAPLLVRDLAALDAERRARPPALLSPRRIGDRVRVVEVARVTDVDFDAGAQEVVAVVEDPAGQRLTLTTAHRSVSPGAVDALVLMLGNGEPKFVAGELMRTARGGWRMSPLGVAGTRVAILDVEPMPKVSLVSRVGHVEPNAGASDADALLDELGVYLETLLMRGPHAAREAGPRLAVRLDEVSMKRAAQFVRRITRSEPSAIVDLAIYCALTHAE